MIRYTYKHKKRGNAFTVIINQQSWHMDAKTARYSIINYYKIVVRKTLFITVIMVQDSIKIVYSETSHSEHPWLVNTSL